MKLNVQGIEEIELTDPAGLCNPQPLPPGLMGPPPLPSQPSPGNPIPTGIYPYPQTPTPQPAIPGWGDIPRTGDVAMPHRPSVYTRHVDSSYREKWGIGGPMIQQAGNPDPDKWGKNWQARMNGDPDNGNRSTH